MGQAVDQSTLKPLADVQVVVMGTTRGALTNAEGRYRIENVEPGQYVVRATRIGFDGQKETVTVAPGENVIANFALATAAVSLDALVVTATGQQKKKELANAVSNVNADKVVETAPVNSVSQIITGRAAGVTVLQSGGTSGTGSRIRIRGSNSVSLSNEPIVYIDGIRVNNSAEQLSVGIGGQAPSALNDINPENIESIEIIKGPSATTLYGTDAANGVIWITTKKGGSTAPRFNAWVEQGILENSAEFPENFALMDRTTGKRTFLFLQPSLEAARAQELIAFSPLDDPEQGPFGTGYRQQYGASMAGGGDGINYYISAEYEDEVGVLELPDSARRVLEESFGELPTSLIRPNQLEKVNLRANIGATPFENLNIGVSAGYTQGDLYLPQNDNNALGIVPSGLLGSPFREQNFGFGFLLPSEVFSIETLQESNRFTGGFNANWQPANWLTGRASVGLDTKNRLDSNFAGPEQVPFNTRTLQGFRTANRIQTSTYTGDLGFTASFEGPSAISSRTSAGVQYFRDIVRGSFARGENLVPGSKSIASAAKTEAGEFTTEAITLGTYIEQQIGFMDRFFLTGALRGDDNSAFGQEFDVVIYPKVGLSAVVIEDQGEPLFNAINSLRLRAAYGSSGLAPGATDAVQFFTAEAATLAGQDVTGVRFAELGNPELKPETSTEFEVGFDLGLLDGRLALEGTYYNKETSDALVNRVLPPSAGAGVNRFENLGAVRNTGVEGVVNAILVDTRPVRWELNLTGSKTENELLDLGDDDAPIIFGEQRFQEGFPLGAFFGRPITVNDANNDGIITRDEVTVADEAVFLGSPFPETELAVRTEMRLFDRVGVSALFDYRGDFLQNNFTEFFRCRFRICEGLFNPDASLDEQARALVAGTFPAANRTVAPFIEDASFWKFRELAVTFFAPQQWARTVGAEQLNIVFMGRNLATWTDYTGLDPEISQTGQSNFTTREFLSQPPVRTFSVRANIAF